MHDRAYFALPAFPRSLTFLSFVDVSLFSLFLAAQRTASLRHDDETQASLINRLLRSYLHYSLYDQADKLISKTNFPASAPNSQYARYHYFLGRIKAVQLDYTAAHTNLQQAIRRAPAPKLAPGFYQAVHKLFVVVELLMGDIPDRSLFRHPVLEKALRGYFDIVKGELAAFFIIRVSSADTSQRSVQALFRNSSRHFRRTRLALRLIRLTRSSHDSGRT